MNNTTLQNTPIAPELTCVGEDALMIRFEDRIDEKINQSVHQLDRWLNNTPATGLIETLPSFTSILLIYDPLRIDLVALKRWVKNKVTTCPWKEMAEARVIELMVNYGGLDGPDLGTVARVNGLTPAEVICIHSQGEYTVAMMGFSPGFVYLSGLDPCLATPRLSSPRVSVPPGSVGIAAAQTGVYSIASPGGWQLIGRTQQRLFDPGRQPAFLFEPGNRVRFIPTYSSETPGHD